MACLLIFKKNNYGWQIENYCTLQTQLVLYFKSFKTAAINEVFSNISCVKFDFILHISESVSVPLQVEVQCNMPTPCL